MGSHPADDEPCALGNVRQLRLSYLLALSIPCVHFQIAAPEGFSARRSAPAHTHPGVAGSEPGLLVSIVAFLEQIGEYYAIRKVNGQLGSMK